jgi:hypothetical protein
VNQYNTTIIFCLAEKGLHLVGRKNHLSIQGWCRFCYGITAQQVDGTRRATAKEWIKKNKKFIFIFFKKLGTRGQTRAVRPGWTNVQVQGHTQEKCAMAM